MKNTLKILYPEYFIFPFNNEEEVLEFIKDNFIYIPYKSYKTGILEKFQIRKILFDP